MGNFSDLQLKLIEPFYGFRIEGRAKKPSYKEISMQILYCLNPMKSMRNCVGFVCFSYHLATFPFLLILILRFNLHEILFFIASTLFMAHIYNTLWYHRYCSHFSFKFTNYKYTRIFLWSDPLFFSEEIYAIPHFIHHQITEQAGDPYGPHIGWLATYLAPEITARIDTNISQDHYEKLLRNIHHIGLITNNFKNFKKSGCVEKALFFFSRKISGQLIWLMFSFFLGGAGFVYAWLAGTFVTSAIIRDFNWRGHGGNFRKNKIKGWEFHHKSLALNQHFYGYLASEWHDNHHQFPNSANNGYLPTQFDLSFQLIKCLKIIGIVDRYNDAMNSFFKKTELAP